MTNLSKNSPNILITGTPGVGKSLMSRILSEKAELSWIDVSKFAIEKECLEEYDEVYQCPILDEEKLLDELEGPMSEGGNIVDYHGADFFPERWFDIVFVLRTDNTILYDRLRDRGYTGKKLEDNIDCEIFQTILDEAKSAYRAEIVHELTSNNLNQVEYTSILKNVANAIFETGGFIRNIENWGNKELPCKTSAHDKVHTHAGHFLLCFDVPPSKLGNVYDHCKRHLNIIRAEVYKQNMPEKNVRCTFHEEQLPPPYRPSVQKLIDEASKQKRNKSKFRYNTGLDYYPFMR